MQATDILMQEHELILSVLDALEKGANRLRTGESVQAQFFLDAADFIRNFADGCHHMKEEGVLFKTMVDRGFPEQHGPIAVMLAEHEQGRDFTHEMAQAAQKLAGGDASAADAVARAALGYVALLRQHIQKENQILFPMAGNFIPESEQAAVVAGFEKVEREDTGAGVHEKYEALARSLRQQMQL
jgi:hemerythrin-like domain-containing protein